MSITEKQINNLLAQKQEIDDRVMQTNRMETDHRWMVDAVELLLRSVKELREELREQGILR
jgi:hypothetical protein